MNPDVVPRVNVSGMQMSPSRWLQRNGPQDAGPEEGEQVLLCQLWEMLLRVLAQSCHPAMTWSTSENGEDFETWYKVATAPCERHVLDFKQRLCPRMPRGQIVAGRVEKFSPTGSIVRSCKGPLRPLLKES
jgi:hypothetical protein